MTPKEEKEIRARYKKNFLQVVELPKLVHLNS